MGNTEGDAELLRRLRQGEPAAAEELLMRYKPQVCVFISTLLRDSGAKVAGKGFESQVESVFDEAYLKVLKRAADGEIGRSEEALNLIAYMRTTVRNLLVDRHRKEKLRQAAGMEEVEKLADPRSAQENIVADRELIQQFLGRLNEEYRTLVLLRLEDRSFQEIADILQMEVNSVRARFSRCIALLRRFAAENQ